MGEIRDWGVGLGWGMLVEKKMNLVFALLRKWDRRNRGEGVCTSLLGSLFQLASQFGLLSIFSALREIEGGRSRKPRKNAVSRLNHATRAAEPFCLHWGGGEEIVCALNRKSSTCHERKRGNRRMRVFGGGKMEGQLGGLLANTPEKKSEISAIDPRTWKSEKELEKLYSDTGRLSKSSEPVFSRRTRSSDRESICTEEERKMIEERQAFTKGGE